MRNRCGIRLFCGVIFGVCAASVWAQTPSFRARRDYFSSEPNAVAVGDVNGDGIPDLIDVTGPICVWFGTGDGTFQTGPCSSSTSGASSIAVADFDGDGKLDLAFTLAVIDTAIYVVYGNGDGTFTATAALSVTGTTNALTSADLDRDGKPDLVVAGSSGAFVFLNQGSRAFSGPVAYALGNTFAVAVGDLNGDGIPDIAAGASPGVALLLGTGSGVFISGPTLILSKAAGNLGLGDLNHDRLLDIVVCGNKYDVSKEVSVFLGTGGGSFGPPTNISFPSGTVGLAVGDLNQDGYPDVVVIDGNPAEIALLINKGNGAFARGPSYTVGAAAVDVVLAPLRKRGLLDIVTAAYLSFDISVLLNQGKGVYQDAVHIPFSSGAGPIASADFNGDGHPDLAVTTGTGVSILLGTGKPAKPFHAGVNLTVAGAFDTIVGDFDGDGIADLAVSEQSQISVFFGLGNGNFSAPVITALTLTFNPFIFAGDFNGDGKLDLITTDNQILFGKGDGTFQPAQQLYPQISKTSPMHWAVVADLNGDGRPDVAVIGGPAIQQLIILINHGDGTFQPPVLYPVGDSLQIQAAVADFNGDGIPDIVLALEHNGLYVFLGNGRGGFRPAVVTPWPYYLFGVVTGDFNGDGKPDVAMSTSTESNVAIYLGNSDGTFQAPIYFGTGTSSSFLVTGAFHGQTTAAKPDLAVASLQAIDVLINNTR